MKPILILPLLLLFFSCEEPPEEHTTTPIMDCAGIENGEAQLDSCGICDADLLNDCIKDCDGVWGGVAELDECGECNGDGTSCTLSFSLTDRNPESSTWSQLIGPEFFRGKVSVYYFPSSET